MQTTETPMTKLYRETKAANPDCVCLFRMGDFYEAFHDDAKTVASVLGLVLGRRDKGDNAIPMAGFPHHVFDTYVARLVKAGHRVAICEQV